MLSNPNPDDFTVGREAEADANLLVKFFHKEREDVDATRKEGRPMYREIEYMEIRIPGKRDAQVCRPATERDKQRFPRHYDMFKQRVAMPNEGTPLSEWPQISRSLAEELSFLQIKTVEQLVSASDTHLSRIHGGLGLKQRAEAFLKYADQTKLVAEKEALQTKLADQDAQMAAQAAQMAEMQAAIAKMAMAGGSDDDDAPKRRSSRRAKAPVEMEEAETPEV